MLPGQIAAECHPQMTFQACDLVVEAPPSDLIARLGIGLHERRQPPPQDDRSGRMRPQAVKNFTGPRGGGSAQLPLPGVTDVIKIPRSDDQRAVGGRSGGDSEFAALRKRGGLQAKAESA